MRLLVDAHVFDEAPQGTRTYLKGLYSEVISANDPEIEMFFCANDIDNLRTEFGEHHNVNYLKIESRNRVFRLVWEFPMLISKYRIDAAHFQYISPLIKRCKEIITIHDVLFLDFPDYFPVQYRIIKRQLFARSAKRSNRIFTVSESSKSSISKHFRIPSEKIFLTPNAVSNEFFKTIGPDKKNALRDKYGLRKFILYVSRIEPRKNQVMLLQAYHELELWRENYDLVFIGRTDIESVQFTRYLSRLEEDAMSHVKVLDNINFEELNTFYKSCDLFVYPSLAEGFGIPPLEAAASQCVVLCADTTAMQDFDFFNGNLFDPTDLNQLKLKILKNLGMRNEEEIKKIQSLIQERYSWKAIALNFLAEIKKIK